MSLSTKLCSEVRQVHIIDYNKHIKYTSPWKPHFNIQLSLRKPKQHTLTLPNKDPHLTVEISTSTGTSKKKRERKSTSTDVLRLMDTLSLPIPPDIYASLIKECTLACDSTRAVELHTHLRKSGLNLTLPLINRLLLMHVSCSHLDAARNLFDQMTVKKDFNSWAIITVGCLENAQHEEAIGLFHKMLDHNIHMSEFPTWLIVCILKACVDAVKMEVGKQVHGLLLKLGSTNDLHLSGSLINFYGKFKCLEGANLVFDKLLHRNTVVWTAKMVNNCREGRYKEVMGDFREMVSAGMRRNSFTLSRVLRACARMVEGGDCGRQVHADAIKLGLESDGFVQCGLIDMYGKCGMVRDAERVFEMIKNKRNTACWHAMVMGYVRNGLYIEAIKLVYGMKATGIPVKAALINQIRMACGSNTMQSMHT